MGSDVSSLPSLSPQLSAADIKASQGVDSDYFRFERKFCLDSWIVPERQSLKLIKVVLLRESPQLLGPTFQQALGVKAAY